MPQVLKKAMEKGHHHVSAFPIMYEHWTDIGNMGDYEKAKKEFDR
jgi:NDP-sugar pyrophosphorylase family protein